MSRHIANALGVVALVYLLGCFGLLLDHMDNRNEWAESQALIDAQLSANEQARKERAANEICGNAEPRWIDETTVTCAQRKGPKQSGAVTLAGGVL